MNPCPCGYYGDSLRACTCSESTVTRYQKRLSGPLLDRHDIHVEVPRVDYEKLAPDSLAESSEVIRIRVEKARATAGSVWRLLARGELRPIWRSARGTWQQHLGDLRSGWDERERRIPFIALRSCAPLEGDRRRVSGGPGGGAHGTRR